MQPDVKPLTWLLLFVFELLILSGFAVTVGCSDVPTRSEVQPLVVNAPMK